LEDPVFLYLCARESGFGTEKSTYILYTDLELECIFNIPRYNEEGKAPSRRSINGREDALLLLKRMRMRMRSRVFVKDQHKAKALLCDLVFLFLSTLFNAKSYS
jgi:hypothetical protein